MDSHRFARATAATLDDPRLGDLLGTALSNAAPAAVIVGFPCDDGVRRNGGRPGAAEGPTALREELYRLTPDPETLDAFTSLVARTADLGDLRLSGDLSVDQHALASTLAPHLERNAFAIVLGGGHETSYGHFLAYVSAGRAVSVLNWDAHADVRPLVDGEGHSGSPFRQAISHPSGICRSYTVAGLLPHATSRAHVEFLQDYGAAAVWRREVTVERLRALYAEAAEPVMASFDLDALDAAYAPGVSAPATGGLTPELWLEAAYLAGRTPALTSLDVVELNPRLDRDRQTAALAAATVWWALKGLAERR